MKKSHYATIVFALIATLCQATASAAPAPWGSVIGAVGALCVSLAAAFGLSSPALDFNKDK
jgi:hypothetical protein